MSALESGEPRARPLPAVRLGRRSRRVTGVLALAAFIAGGGLALTGYVRQYLLYRGFGPPVSHVPLAQQGRIESFSFASSALGGRRERPLVYLPAGYDTHPHLRYPVLYLLHGTPGDPRTAFVNSLHVGPRLDAMIAAHRMRALLLVMPPGSPGTYDAATEWANGPRPGDAWFRYLTHDLVRAVDARYRTIADARGRGVAGYSSGADAAVNAILWHPHVFSLAEAWSGDFRQTPRTVGRAPALVERFSALDTAPARARAVARAHGVVYLYAGRRDRVLSATLAVGRAFERAGVRTRLDVTAGGHAWELWASRIDGALRFASAHLARPR